MSLHDGLSSLGSLSLASEKHITVVFDFGYAYTKVGFAGENSPRAIVKSIVKSRCTQETTEVFKYESEDQLIDQLVDFIHPLYFKCLLANSKDRRVVIVENLLNSSIQKNAIAKVFFKYFEVVSVCFAPSHLVSIMPLAINTALVVDIGYNEATIIPIYEGVLILDAWQAVPTGSRALLESLSSLLSERVVCLDESGKEQSFDQVMESISSHGAKSDILEDILVRTCFVSTLDRSDKLQLNKSDRSNEPPPPPPSVSYPVSRSSTMAVPGTVRELAAEVLFETDQDFLSLPCVILQCLIQCPMDTRLALAQNIFVTGGAAAMKGLKSRLMSELRHLASRSPFAEKIKVNNFKMHFAPAKDNYVAWLGGSILGCTEAVASRSISREVYAAKRRIPDWSDAAEPCQDSPSGRTIA